MARDKKGRFTKGMNPPKHKVNCICSRCTKTCPTKNIIMTQETKNKIGNANRGKIRSEEFKQLQSQLKKLNPPKTIFKIGQRAWNYINGNSMIYPREFKLMRPIILERDNFTCQLCGDILPKTRNLKEDKNFITVHHIDYNKQNSNQENLIALCHLCNISVNNSREEWTNFFQEKLRGRTN